MATGTVVVNRIIPARVRLEWRYQLALILAVALLLRLVFFVGFGLGDDLGYIAYADEILAGRYPPLDPLNQYAYRPLLLLLFAGGIAVFGHTDFGVVAPVLLASLVTTALVFVFVRALIDPGAAWWCALLYACAPFNVVNSTTMTNDVILACLTFASVGVFLTADRSSDTWRRAGLFAASGALMVAAFLVKITILPVGAALMLYSLNALRRRPAQVLRWHSLFYVTAAAGLAGIGVAYYVLTGDALWQLKSETHYYQTYKPDWYVAGAIDYRSLMWQYPRSLFGVSGHPGFRYLEHGLLFWLFMPAAAAAVIWRERPLVPFFVALVVLVFAFFQFYPQYLSPRYLPLVRQERYLEILVPAAVIVVGTALHGLHRRHAVLATAILAVVVGDFVVQASRRHTEYADSQRDVKSLARYAASTVTRAGRPLAVDRPARNGLAFYLRDVPVHVEPIPTDPIELRHTYVAVGGARSFWWSQGEVFDVPHGSVPDHWILAYEAPGRRAPWRPSDLRVYYVGVPDEEGYARLAPAHLDMSVPLQPGLVQSAYPHGFGTEGALVTAGIGIPDLDTSVPLAAARLEWTGWLRAEDGVYTFESTSDDGSWVYVNGELVLDNGGTHPARLERRSVRLARGWYAFMLRYEDTGGDRLLRFRVHRDHQVHPLDQHALFFWSPDAPPVPDAGAGGLQPAHPVR